MNHDTKVGLGLGILLVGIVSAFYFREQPTSQDPLPEIQSVEALDREISKSLSVVNQQLTALQKFEHQFKPGLDLDEIDLDQEMPVVTDHLVKVGPDLEPVRIETEIVSIDEESVPTFDPEFEFLNEPEVSDSPVSTPGSSEELATAGPPLDQNHSAKIPVTVVVESEGNPPKELPLSVEMFSEDLQSPDVGVKEIPLQLHPITIDSLAVMKPEIQGNADVKKAQADVIPERIEPVRDPRIIVPKRVRLNEPIARRTLEEFREPQNNPISEQTTPSRPESRSKPLPDTSNNGLPSLEGLEPIEPTR